MRLSTETAAEAGEGPSGFIELKDVRLAYSFDGQETLAIDGVDLSLDRGEFIAVVGPSGCGKSSLMRLVTGLTRPQAGSITIDGVEVRGPVRGVGMAFQNSTLLPWRTTLENVLLPLEIVEPYKSNRRRDRGAHVARAEALLDSVSLHGAGPKFPWQLSGGMQQRANLCRSLIHQPSLVMLDEPFGALDAFTREELWDVMQSLWLERRFSAVLVTHDLREAVYLADTVYVMSQRPGRIIARRSVPLPRPRTLEATFTPEFVDLVHDLRTLIVAERAR